MNYPTLVFPVLVILALFWFFRVYYKNSSPRKGTLEWIPLAIKPKLTFQLKRHKMVKLDYIALLIILIIASFVSFLDLGDTTGVNSFYQFQKGADGNNIILEFSEDVEIDAIRYYVGLWEADYEIQFSTDGLNWTDQTTLEAPRGDIFKWKTNQTEDENKTARFVKISPSKTGAYLGELGFYDPEGMLISEGLIVNRDDFATLFDEQDLIPAIPSYMNQTYFDEIYYAQTSYQLIEQENPYEMTHPPLGKDIQMIGVLIFGLNAFGWRFMGTLFGVLLLIPFYILIKNLFGKTPIAVCGTVIFCFDFMRYVQTRIATIDTYSVLFVILMYLFMYRYITTDYDAPMRKSLPSLFLTGLAFGLGAAAKWTSIYAGIGLVFLYVLNLVLRGRYMLAKGQKREFISYLGSTILFSVLFFLVIPAGIYYVSYFPFAVAKGQPSTLANLFSRDYLDMVLGNQKYMYSYHSELTATHPYQSSWYQWILDIRPILFYREYGLTAENTKSAITSFNNPIITWGGLLATISLFVSYVRRRDGRTLFIIAGYLGQLIPWIFITRCAFAYHYFTCIIFLVLAICYVLNRILEMKKGRYKLAVYGFTGSVVALFWIFYPALSGLEVSVDYCTYILRWFPSWPL